MEKLKFYSDFRVKRKKQFFENPRKLQWKYFEFSRITRIKKELIARTKAAWNELEISRKPEHTKNDRFKEQLLEIVLNFQKIQLKNRSKSEKTGNSDFLEKELDFLELHQTAAISSAQKIIAE